MSGQPNRHAQLTVAWGDAEHTFRLGIGELRELQEKTDAGPLELVQRLMRGTWRLDDVRETIRLGLVGGGMEPLRALGLVARYVDERPLTESVPVAQAVLAVLLFGGDEDNPVGKGQAKKTASDSRTGASPSPASTAPVQ